MDQRRSRRKKSILTVGDGDLSLSLAIHRAYGAQGSNNNDEDKDGAHDDNDDGYRSKLGDNSERRGGDTGGGVVRVTASVLEPDRETLVKTYPDTTSDCLKELERENVNVLFGIDATQLHKHFSEKFAYSDDINNDDNSGFLFDVVSFHHPHLGLASLSSGSDEAEAYHADRHHQLLCHYLHSASQVSKFVHVCLCGTQPETWRLLNAASKQGLLLTKTIKTAAPFSMIWSDSNEYDTNDNDAVIDRAAPARPHYAAPRRYRNGKLGSRHFLGKWGYRHRRTEGQRYNGTSTDMNVNGSMHFVFQKPQQEEDLVASKAKKRRSSSSSPQMTTAATTFMCKICHAEFHCQDDLEQHYEAPVRPEISATSIPDKVCSREVLMTSQYGTDRGSETKTTSDSRKEKNDLRATNHSAKSTTEQPQDSIFTSSESAKMVNVPDGCVGKRLRWFIYQHLALGLSKRRAESMIQAGLVGINGVPVVDSGRILKSGDTVSINMSFMSLSSSESETTKQKNVKIEYRYEHTDVLGTRSVTTYLVAWKPSGVRARGEFLGTLENIISSQEKKSYSCLSSGVETSLCGLCVLSCVSTDDPQKTTTPKLRVLHTLTALVHGDVGKEWWPSRKASLELNSKWRAKKRKDLVQQEDTTKTDCPSCKTFDIEIVPKENSLLITHTQGKEIKILEEGPEINDVESSTLLSTLEIITSHPSSSSVCHYLRQIGYPVVGDCYSSKEYLSLKRSIRNRLKDKLCMGCFKVEIFQDAALVKVVQLPVPDKLSSRFWSKFERGDEQTK